MIASNFRAFFVADRLNEDYAQRTKMYGALQPGEYEISSDGVVERFYFIAPTPVPFALKGKDIRRVR